MDGQTFARLSKLGTFTLKDELLFYNTPFTELEDFIEKVGTQKITTGILRYLVQHPECDLKTFKKYYSDYKKIFLITKAIFRNAPIFSNLDAIAYTMECESDMDSIFTAIKESSLNTSIADNLIVNEKTNQKFRDRHALNIVKLTKNTEYLKYISPKIKNMLFF